VSSFRRNLQREHVDRLISLALSDRTPSPAMRTISTLAKQELRSIGEMAKRAGKGNPNTYAKAHLADIDVRVTKALEAAYVIQR
jgi:hypothetical protein